MLTGKATHEQLKRHNRQLLLRAVYSGLANNRAALAQISGLAKPTVSDLISELIDEGLLIEGGHGESTDSGGKRPRLLEFVPDARQVIGVSLDARMVSGVLSNLSGRVFARHHAELEGDDPLTILKEVINGLVAQLDAPLLCLGIGIEGIIDNDAGIVSESKHLGWHQLALADLLSDDYRVPVYIGNNTELAALAQSAFNSSFHNLVTILINSSVEVGMSLEGALYHRGSDIGELRVLGRDTQTYGRLDSFLSWASVQNQMPDDARTYMHIRYNAANGDESALALYDRLADYLAEVVTWIIGLLRPDHISLVGPIVDLGDLLLECVTAKTKRFLPPSLVDAVTFSLADSTNLSAAGAITQAIQKELGIP